MKGYKTILFNVVMTCIMVVRMLNPEAELPDEASVNASVDAIDAALTTAWGVGNMILRAVTNTPIFKPKQE